MLSDEEKKAIDKLKRSANYFVMPIYETKIILELIEKQSKEIEELKREKAKRSWVHIKENGEVEPLFYISEDKIKAKIEELEKMNIYEFETMNAIEVLQSLLEKE